MAGRGPAPAEQKRRRNKPPELDELPAAGYQGEYPPLPASYGVEYVEMTEGEDGEQRRVTRRRQVRYLHETRAWFEIWARSPMAARFTMVEWNRLHRVARLVDAYYRRPSQALAAELRLQEASLGGTPLDRLRAQMRIGAPDDASASTPPRRGGSSSRRARLSVVKS